MEEQDVVLITEHGKIYMRGEVPYDVDEKIMVANEGGRITAEINRELGKSMEGVVALFKGMNDVRDQLMPDEFAIELGVRLDLKTGFFVVSAGSAVDFRIKMAWNKPQ